MYKFWLFLLVFLFAGNIMPANAHRLNSAMTIIEAGQGVNKIEISHKIYTHDLEHALDLNGVGLNYFESTKGKAQLKAYIDASFRIYNADGNMIKLDFIGAEIDGDVLYVYYEAQYSIKNQFAIDSNILQDLSESQINYVNIHREQNVETLVFAYGQVAQWVSAK